MISKMDERALHLFDLIDAGHDSDDASLHMQNVLSDLGQAANIEPSARSRSVHNVLTEIYDYNQQRHSNNMKTIDAYNRKLFRYLEATYEILSTPESSDSGLLAKLQEHRDALREMSRTSIERPNLTLSQIHILRSLCPHTIAKAFSYIDDACRAECISDLVSPKVYNPISRVIHHLEIQQWENNPLYNLFQDRDVLNQAIRKLREEGLRFVLVPGETCFGENFLVTSQTKARKKRSESQRASTNNVLSALPFERCAYACLGASYCHCTAFYHQVLIGTPGPRGHHVEHGAEQITRSPAAANEFQHDLFCKHTLAVQLLLAMTSAPTLSSMLDVRCFCLNYTNISSTLPGEFCTAACYFSHGIAVPADQYMKIITYGK